MRSVSGDSTTGVQGPSFLTPPVAGTGTWLKSLDVFKPSTVDKDMSLWSIRGRDAEGLLVSSFKVSKKTIFRVEECLLWREQCRLFDPSSSRMTYPLSCQSTPVIPA